MAEFQEVMRQWSRMCEAHDDGCASCDIYVDCGAKYPESRTGLNIKRIEDTVIDWAKDHPEPVYPTWIDVMKMYGVTDETGYCYLDSAYKPIPADIAKKLGLEPKEEDTK